MSTHGHRLSRLAELLDVVERIRDANGRGDHKLADRLDEDVLDQLDPEHADLLAEA
jgi:hypothetical protein